jgi:hypothetical protein
MLLPTAGSESVETTGVILGVLDGGSKPLLGQLIAWEHSVDRAGLDARVAVDALLSIDIELIDHVKIRLVRRGMNAVDRTHLNTGVVLGTDAWLCDHVRHIVTYSRARPS